MQEDKVTTQAPSDIEAYIEWTVQSKPDFERSTAWYVVAITTAILLLIYSIVTVNFLFAILIILIALIVIINDAKPLRNLRVAITNQGLLVGNALYRYRSFESFYIIYEPPRIQKLVFERGGPRQELTFDIIGVDPIEVREILLQVVPENLEREDEPSSDVLQRFFKL